jgi:hypothetical protein
MLLKMAFISPPRTKRTAITTTAISTKINAYSTIAWPSRRLSIVLPSFLLSTAADSPLLVSRSTRSGELGSVGGFELLRSTHLTGLAVGGDQTTDHILPIRPPSKDFL